MFFSYSSFLLVNVLVTAVVATSFAHSQILQIPEISQVSNTTLALLGMQSLSKRATGSRITGWTAKQKASRHQTSKAKTDSRPMKHTLKFDERCTTADRRKIRMAIHLAKLALELAWHNLEELGENPDPEDPKLQPYIEFLGAYDKARYETVYKHIGHKSAYDIPRFSFMCETAKRCTDADGSQNVAFSHALVARKIHICPLFFKASVKSRTITLIHEIMHFTYKLPGSARHVDGANQGEYRREYYYSAAVLNLAKTDPAYAVENADSLARFTVAMSGVPLVTSPVEKLSELVRGGPGKPSIGRKLSHAFQGKKGVHPA